MDIFWFYIKLGLGHVLDLSAYDHILFLMALVIPFTFRMWKQILTLVTVFTIAHCLSLALSVYKVVEVEAAWIEFLIPVTIVVTALFNLRDSLKKRNKLSFQLQIIATGFFGLIHGFGFSNYFNMLMAGEEEKLSPLLGFATGIEISQLIVILMVLIVAALLEIGLKLPRKYFVIGTTAIVILITIPMILDTWPG
ncbi:MAG: HupE/UreJ family protein [Flavobacteriaceae bacterium]|nr:HupE/UreJ family protein [Muriicola sp.]NNC61231.1 HupE/UreJ family protein [Eudoraea sp.]NNK20924.1 HupE/UreJ family protein [Flavobacteriaceae bacterium]MBT8291526.1 HupE/UreJ family protein [Muriicola sp.]NNK36730.1 HupE/UreJ family protein [Eudoraea sp.]